jgi:glutamate-1-semialdehyde 2,1-aminomutase
MRSITPDLKTFGKWLGGGITFGAFGGRADIMAAYDPSRPDSLPHSGTFNNNTLAMHAGCVGLTEIYTPSVADAFTTLGNEFLGRLNQVSKHSILCFTGLGTVMTAHFPVNGEKDIRNAGDVEGCNELKELFWLEMLDNGFWLARRGLIALILDTPRSELDRFVDAVGAFIKRNEPLLKARV